MNSRHHILMVSGILLSLTACGENPEGSVYPPSDDKGMTVSDEDTSKSEAPTQASVPQDYSGTWTTSNGAVNQESTIIVYVNSSGEYTVDVMATVEGQNAVMENTTGKATISASGIKGEITDGPGVHGVLRAMGSWSITAQGENGTLKTQSGKTYPLRRIEG